MAEAYSVTYVVNGPWWVPWAILAACAVIATVLALALRVKPADLKKREEEAGAKKRGKA